MGSEENRPKQNQSQNKLQVVIITIGISSIVNPILQSRHNVVGIVECPPRGRNEIKKRRLLYRIVRLVYHGVRRTPLNLAAFAKEKHIPYYFMSEGSSKDLEDWIKLLNPDLIVVFYMSQLLKKNIFSIPRYGTINLHPSLLPKYRGPNPWFWTYYNNDLQPGVTIHYIDEGEDTGDIIYQDSFDIPLGMPFREFYRKAIDDLGVKLLIRAMDDIGAGKAPRHKQINKNQTERARSVEPDEGRRLIDWEEWPVQRVWHLLRGAVTWTDILPKMRGIYRGQSWDIDGFEVCPLESSYKIGRIYSERGRIFLACKDGKIILRKRFTVKRFVVNLFSG